MIYLHFAYAVTQGTDNAEIPEAHTIQPYTDTGNRRDVAEAIKTTQLRFLPLGLGGLASVLNSGS